MEFTSLAPVLLASIGCAGSLFEIVSIVFPIFYGGAGFDSPAKVASRPRTMVLPLLGGTFFCPFMYVSKVGGHCTASIVLP